MVIAGEINKKLCISLYDGIEIMGKRSRGRPVGSLINQLISDTGIRKEGLDRAMDDKNGWKKMVRNVCLRTS